jgi:hypothetical protein
MIDKIITIIPQTLTDCDSANGSFISNSSNCDGNPYLDYITECPECGKKLEEGIDYRIYLQPDYEHGAIYCFDCFNKLVELVNKVINRIG